MKLKPGPVLVIGILVVLIGLSVVLAPAPPPPEEGHEHEHEHATPPKKEAVEKPSLSAIKKAIASDNVHVVMDAFENLQALLALSRTPQEKEPVLTYVMSLLNDRREFVRASALGLLSSLGGEIDYRPIVKLAQSDPSPDVKRSAFLALAQFNAGGPVEQFLRQATKHPDPGIRAVAVVALTQMLSKSGKAGVDALALLLGQYDNDASAKAAMQLHQRGGAALPTLIRVLETSPSGPARHAAAMCIGLICAGYNPYIEKFAKAAQVTHRQEYGHRASNPAGVLPLIRCLEHDPYAPAREIAAQGLGYLGDERAVRPLARALSDPDKYVRRRAAAALITLPARAAVPELAQAATRDKDPDVRRFAVEALGWVGDPVVVPALIQATKDPVAEVRRYAAIQLGKLRDSRALEALAELVDETPDPDPDVRWAAVVAIGKLEDRRAEKILVHALSDPSPQVANSAERALQRLGIAIREQAGFRG